jgi:energy-coupling factor transport system permease protein
VTGSFFLPGSGPLHRLDPRCKLLLALLFTVLFFLPLPLPLLGAYLGALALAIALSLGARELLRPLRTIAPLLVLVLLLTPPFHRGGQAWLRVGQIVLLSAEGALEAARLALRLAGISFAFFALLRSTDPAELILGLRAFGLPFGAGLVVSVALQYVPGLKSLYDQVQDAHRLRQAEQGAPGREGPLRSLRSLLPLLTSVLILSIRRIPALAMALELRGVGLRGPRSSLRRLPGGRRLAWGILASALTGAAAVAAALLFP